MNHLLVPSTLEAGPLIQLEELLSGLPQLFFSRLSHQELLRNSSYPYTILQAAFPGGFAVSHSYCGSEQMLSKNRASNFRNGHISGLGIFLLLFLALEPFP